MATIDNLVNPADRHIARSILSAINHAYKHSMARDERDIVGRSPEAREAYVVAHYGESLIETWCSAEDKRFYYALRSSEIEDQVQEALAS